MIYIVGKPLSQRPGMGCVVKKVGESPVDALIAAWTERREERLLREGIKSARRWEGWVREMTDAEFLGLAAVVDRERDKRGDLFLS